MDRPVPFDLVSERGVLGSILLDRDAVSAVAATLVSDFFYLEKNARIFEAACACAARGVPPDLATVAAELGRRGDLDLVGGLAYLGELAAEVPTALHIEYYADSVRQTALHRRLIETGGKIAALGYEQREGFAAVMTTAASELEAVAQAWSAGEPVGGIPASELARRTPQPVRWCIPELICEGFGYLAAKPGMGKTWMLLQWARAVATGGYVLGSIPVAQPGKVLFFALEDNEASLAERLAITFQGDSWPANLICYHMESGPNKTLPLRPLDDGGLLQLELQLRQHPDTAMVVIDTLTAVAPIHRSMNRGTAYTDDYRGYMPLRSLADRYHIPILGSWHYNKAGSVDAMEMVSGSMGLPSVAINRLGIVRERDSDEAIFCSFAKRGREVRWQVRYDPVTCQWIKLGDAKEFAISEQKRAILDALEEAGRAMRLADLARAADMKYNNTIQLTKRMVAEKLIVKRDSDGLYDLPERAKDLFSGPDSDHSDRDSDRGVITTSEGVRTPETSNSDRNGRADHRAAGQKTVIGAQNRSLWYTPPRPDAESDSDQAPITMPITADHYGGDDNLFAGASQSQRALIRLYLLSNTPDDLRKAAQLCKALGIDFDRAFAHYHPGATPPAAD